MAAKNHRSQDLTGKTFGQLTVISKADRKRKAGGLYWTCRCSCPDETIFDVVGYSLTSGATGSCGCGRKKHPRPAIGQAFGSHVVQSRSPKKGWICVCVECGVQTTRTASVLAKGLACICMLAGVMFEVRRATLRPASHVGVRRHTVNARLRRGWPLDRALSEPLHAKYSSAHRLAPPDPNDLRGDE